MGTPHDGGNAIPEITREEHDHTNAAKRVTLVGGVTVAVSNSIATVFQGGAPWSMGGNVASGAVDSGNPIKIGGVFTAAKATLTDGQRSDLQVGNKGSLNVTLLREDNTTAIIGLADNADATAPSSSVNKLAVVNRNIVYNTASGLWDRMAADRAGNTRVTYPYSYNNFVSTGTVLVKSGAGFLHTLTVNTRSTTGTAVLYDSLTPSGTKIATIDTALSTTAFLYDVNFNTGLSLQTTGAAPADITVSFN